MSDNLLEHNFPQRFNNFEIATLCTKHAQFGLVCSLPLKTPLICLLENLGFEIVSFMAANCYTTSHPKHWCDFWSNWWFSATNDKWFPKTWVKLSHLPDDKNVVCSLVWVWLQIAFCNKVNCDKFLHFSQHFYLVLMMSSMTSSNYMHLSTINPNFCFNLKGLKSSNDKMRNVIYL